MNILVLNCGSSTVKFQIIQTDPELIKNDAERCLASGNCEKIGSQEGLVTLKAVGRDPYKDVRPLADHREAVDVVLKWIPTAGIEGITSLKDIDAVGHRVLHGGERFVEPALVTEEVMQGIDYCSIWGPLHNPANLKGIQACRALLGENVPQVAVFDTAFHSTLPEENYIYGLPYEYYEKYKVRRYGFHGTSHRFISLKYADMMGKAPQDVNIICLHLGNGASLCAIKNGRCYDTSMGLTPLEGLLMGTRCGDIDPAIIPFICEKEGLTIKEMDTVMNKKSGLLGLAGMSDMRDLESAEANGDHKAALALKIFCGRVKKYLCAYLGEMEGQCEAIVFTGGVGQNSDVVRGRVCQGLEFMGLSLDAAKNSSVPRSTGGEISSADSRIKIYALPTNEEIMIARDTVAICFKK